MRKEIIRVYSMALLYKKHYDDSNPNVGMGPSLDVLLDELVDECGVELSNAEKKSVMRETAKYF